MLQGDLAQLNETQQQIALLIAEGWTDAQIAGKLHLSPAALQAEINNVLRRLGVKTRSQIPARIRQLPMKGIE